MGKGIRCWKEGDTHKKRKKPVREIMLQLRRDQAMCKAYYAIEAISRRVAPPILTPSTRPSDHWKCACALLYPSPPPHGLLTLNCLYGSSPTYTTTTLTSYTHIGTHAALLWTAATTSLCLSLLRSSSSTLIMQHTHKTESAEQGDRKHKDKCSFCGEDD